LFFANLPPTAKSAHFFEQLAFGSFLSVGQLYDAGCQAFVDATRMVILFQQNIVIIGTRKRGSLWYVDTTDFITQTPNSLRNFPSTFRDSSTMNVTRDLNLPSHTPRIKSPILFTSTYVMNVLGPRGLLKYLAQFHHLAFGFSAISTFCKALDTHHLTSFPGHLTSAQVKNVSFFWYQCIKVI